jgi:hypothetical protein
VSPLSGMKAVRLLSAVSGVNRVVAACADSKVPALGNDMSDPRVAHTAQDCGGPIGRMVIDHVFPLPGELLEVRMQTRRLFVLDTASR